MKNYAKACVNYVLDSQHEDFSYWVMENCENSEEILNAMDENDLDGLIKVIEKNTDIADEHIYYHALKSYQENK